MTALAATERWLFVASRAGLRAELLAATPPSCVQKRALLARLAAALDRSLAARGGGGDDDENDGALAWVFADPDAAGLDGAALDARVLRCAAVHDRDACRALVRASAPRLAPGLRGRVASRVDSLWAAGMRRGDRL